MDSDGFRFWDLDGCDRINFLAQLCFGTKPWDGSEKDWINLVSFNLSWCHCFRCVIWSFEFAPPLMDHWPTSILLLIFQRYFPFHDRYSNILGFSRSRISDMYPIHPISSVGHFFWQKCIWQFPYSWESYPQGTWPVHGYFCRPNFFLPIVLNNESFLCNNFFPYGQTIFFILTLFAKTFGLVVDQTVFVFVFAMLWSENFWSRLCISIKLVPGAAAVGSDRASQLGKIWLKWGKHWSSSCS